MPDVRELAKYVHYCMNEVLLCCLAAVNYILHVVNKYIVMLLAGSLGTVNP